MKKYIEKFGGYIVDTPNIEFVTCGGKVYSYDEVNTASMTNSSETMEITGGQGNFPLAVLDTTKTLEFVFESSEFTMDMFAMANDAEVSESTSYSVMTSKRYDVVEGNKLVITDTVEDGTIYINGFTEGDTAAEGVYTVTVGQGTSAAVLEEKKAAYENAKTTYEQNPSDESAGHAFAVAKFDYEEALKAAQEAGTIVTFAEGDVAVGDTIRVAYKRVIDDAHVVAVGTKAHTTRGSLTATYPVYSDGTDCTDAAIKANVHIIVPNVRATALPGMDNSLTNNRLLAA